MLKFYQCLSLLSLLFLLSCGQSASIVEVDRPSTPGDDTPRDPSPDPDPTPPRFDDSFKITWNMPTHRENCDELTPEEIGGYEIYFGNESKEYETPLVIEDAYSGEYTFNATQEDMFYIALSTYDTNGLYSQKTNEVVVRCEDGECIDETPTYPPVDDPCTNEQAKPLFEIKKKSDQRSLSKAKELCPNFPEDNEKIPYETKSFHVSSTSGRKFQCNWRHGQLGPDHRIGYKNAKLKLPSYSAWDAQVNPGNENQILIPLGLYHLSNQEKIALIDKVGAYPLQNDISTYFEEVPKDLYRVSMARYEKKHVNVRVEYHSVCQDDDENNPEDCLDIEVDENMYSTGKRILTMKLTFEEDDDQENAELTNFIERYNRSEIAIDAFTRIKATSYYDVFKVQKRASTQRPDISELEFVEYDELALADELFGSESVSGGGKDAALNYLQRLLSTTDADKKARYTREEIEKFAPQTLGYAQSFWQGTLPRISEVTSIYATSLDVLNKLFEKDHPVRIVGETYKIVTNYYYGNEEAVKIALDLSQRGLNAEEIDIAASNVHKILQFFEFAPDTRDDAYAKILSLFDRYRENLPLTKRVFKIARRVIGIVSVDYDGGFQNVNINELMDLVENLVVDKGITDVGANHIAELFGLIYRAPMNYDEYNDRYYYEYSEHSYDIQLILSKVSEYIMEKGWGNNVERKVEPNDFRMIENLFTLFMREDLYNLYSYTEAFEKFERYYFEYEVRQVDTTKMKNYLNWLESFRGPHLRDKDEMIEYVEKFLLEPKNRERYANFQSVFRVLASQSPNYDREENQKAFRMTLQTFEDDSLGTPQLQILTQMVYFMKNDFKMPNSESALNRSLQILKQNKNLNRERLNIMRESFNKYLEDGFNREVALRKALEDLDDIVTT